MPIALEISGLGVKRRSQWILRNIDTQIVDLDSLAILGQSGVGKTHLLRAIAGLLVPHEGNIVIDGKNPVSLHQKRQLDVIYQEPCLWPHRSVVQTLRLAAALYDDDVTRQQVTETLRAVDLPTERSFLSKYPHQLSVGEKARLALARSLVLHPAILAMDEPLAAVDAIRREALCKLFHSSIHEPKPAMDYRTP